MKRRWRALVVIAAAVLLFWIVVLSFAVSENAFNRQKALTALGTDSDIVLFRSHVDSGGYGGVTRFAAYAIVRFMWVDEAQIWRQRMAQRCPPGFELSLSEISEMDFKNERIPEGPMFVVVVQITRARAIEWYDFGQWFD